MDIYIYVNRYIYMYVENLHLLYAHVKTQANVYVKDAYTCVFYIPQGRYDLGIMQVSGLLMPLLYNAPLQLTQN